MNKSIASTHNTRQILRTASGTRLFAVLAACVAGSLAVSATAQAQEGGAPAKDGWDVTAGAGVGVRPTYEGSDERRTTALPFVQATYDDMVSLGVDGLNVYWHQDHFRFGAGLSYDSGRKDHKAGGIIDSGDDRLRGMGNISGAAGLKLFGAYNFGRLNVTGAVTKFDGSDNKGLIADVGADLPFKITDKLMVTAHAGATWANQDYMQTFFGVTPTQAADSGFREFTPKAGLKDVEAGVKAVYRLDQHWFVSANLGVRRLEGDAASSPTSFSKNEPAFITVLGYHF